MVVQVEQHGIEQRQDAGGTSLHGLWLISSSIQATERQGDIRRGRENFGDGDRVALSPSDVVQGSNDQRDRRGLRHVTKFGWGCDNESMT